MQAVSMPFILNVDWLWLLGGTAVVYLLLAARARRTMGWPRRRTLWFLGGLGVLLVAFVSPIDNYDVVSLLAHTTQHLLIVFAAAPLLALGSPITLVVAAAPRRVRPGLERMLRAPSVGLATHPALVMPLFVGLVLLTQQPDVADAAMGNGMLHNLQHGVLLVGGFLFWTSVVGANPIRDRQDPRAARLYVAIAVVGLMAPALVVLASSKPAFAYYAALPRPWGGRAALSGQHRTALALFATGIAVLSILGGLALADRRARSAEPG